MRIRFGAISAIIALTLLCGCASGSELQGKWYLGGEEFDKSFGFPSTEYKISDTPGKLFFISSNRIIVETISGTPGSDRRESYLFTNKYVFDARVRTIQIIDTDFDITNRFRYEVSKDGDLIFYPSSTNTHTVKVIYKRITE